MQAAVTDEISAISDAIAERIGQQKFRVWFKNSIRLSISDDYVKVGVPNLFIGGWIEDHFSTDIHSAVKRVTGGERKLIFNVRLPRRDRRGSPHPHSTSAPCSRGLKSWVCRNPSSPLSCPWKVMAAGAWIPSR